MRNMGLFLLSLSVVALLFVGCEKEGTPQVEEPDPDPIPEASSWDVIQQRILDQRCIDCHVSGSSFADQSDLILTADVAYEQLVGRAPKNAAAKADNLLLVGTDGLPSLLTSYLWEKINVRDQEHFFADHPQYGAQMPVGSESLTNGELDYIKEWILAGAPREEYVADVALLEDSSRYELPDFEPLAPPANGIQLHVEPFDVAPNYEREFYYYEPLNNAEPLYVNQIEISMRRGSHHFIAYRIQDNMPSALLPTAGVIRDIRDENGIYDVNVLATTLYHSFVAGTQWPLLNYHFPPGVALEIPANVKFDLNPHYVNRGNETFQGEIYTNFHTVDRASVEHVAKILQLNNFDINLPPNQVTTLSKSFTFGGRRHIFQMFSHAHQFMTEFRVYVIGGDRDGDLVYITYDWEHPPILEFDPPLTLEAGEGLRLETTYDNWTDRTLNFGLLSEDEMMILFGAYYLD